MCDVVEQIFLKTEQGLTGAWPEKLPGELPGAGAGSPSQPG